MRSCVAQLGNRAGMRAIRGQEHCGSLSAQGDCAATRAAEFERLYRENYAFVYNYVNFRMAGSDAVEDVVAEAFCKAARAFGKFDAARAKFSTWVIAIVRNCIIDYWKKERVTVPLDDVPESVFSADDTYPKLNEDADYVRVLLSSIDEADRELVFFKYFEGKRNVDIARELGMNESTVATRLQRALLKMRAVAERGA